MLPSRGWPLPRASLLARHFDVTVRQLAAALGELATCRLIRAAPDGRFVKAISADFVLPLQAAP
jgi:hypothetical protein